MRGASSSRGRRPRAREGAPPPSEARTRATTRDETRTRASALRLRLHERNRDARGARGTLYTAAAHSVTQRAARPGRTRGSRRYRAGDREDHHGATLAPSGSGEKADTWRCARLHSRQVRFCIVAGSCLRAMMSPMLSSRSTSRVTTIRLVVYPKLTQERLRCRARFPRDVQQCAWPSRSRTSVSGRSCPSSRTP